MVYFNKIATKELRRGNLLGKNCIDNTIQIMKLAFEKNKLQETEQYKRLEKLQEKRRKKQ